MDILKTRRVTGMKGRRRARGGVGRGGEASSRVRQPVIRRRARGFRFRGGGGRGIVGGGGARYADLKIGRKEHSVPFRGRRLGKNVS